MRSLIFSFFPPPSNTARMPIYIISAKFREDERSTRNNGKAELTLIMKKKEEKSQNQNSFFPNSLSTSTAHFGLVFLFQLFFIEHPPPVHHPSAPPLLSPPLYPYQEITSHSIFPFPSHSPFRPLH